MDKHRACRLLRGQTLLLLWLTILLPVAGNAESLDTYGNQGGYRIEARARYLQWSGDRGTEISIFDPDREILSISLTGPGIAEEMDIGSFAYDAIAGTWKTISLIKTGDGSHDPPALPWTSNVTLTDARTSYQQTAVVTTQEPSSYLVSYVAPRNIVVRGELTFRWQPARVGDAVSYQVELYRGESLSPNAPPPGPPIWTSQPSMNDLANWQTVSRYGQSARYDGLPLPGGKYTFVVTALDAKGNAASSKAATFLMSAAKPADPLDQWQIRNPLPTSNHLQAVAYGKGVFVAVGGAGTILRSTDGETWISRPLDRASGLYGIAYGGDGFVAVGDYGTVLTSPDGETWTSRESGIMDTLLSVTYGNGLFVAVGGGGSIMTSSDGITWTSRTSGTEVYLYAVAYGDAAFVALGGSVVLRSLDGLLWTRQSLDTTEGPLYGIAYGNGMFVATRFVPEAIATFTSADGLDWTSRRQVIRDYVFGYVRSVHFRNGIFIALSTKGGIFTSSDGISWTRGIPGSSRHLTGVAWGNGAFVAVGYEGAILISTDGASWTSRTSGSTASLSGISYGNGTFVAVSSDLMGPILSSPDGKDWTSRTSGTTKWLSRIAYGNNLFVAVGYGGTILTSPDGINWSPRTSGTEDYFHDITYGNNIFVAVGLSSSIVTSPDGIHWTVQPPRATSLTGIAYGNGIFVAVGGTTLLTSSDGLAWTPVSLPTDLFLSRIAFGKERFVAAGSFGGIFTSPDGVTWTRVPLAAYGQDNPSGNILPSSTATAQSIGFTDGNTIIKTPEPKMEKWYWFRDIVYGNGIFVAVTEHGGILTSDDGLFWTYRRSGTTAGLSAVAYGNRTFVAVGESGTILQTNPMNGLALPGDLNGDEVVDLRDLILAQQVASGQSPVGIISGYASSGADVDQDKRIGAAEAIYILQSLGELRP